MKNLLFCRCGEGWAKYGPLVLRLAVGVVFAMHGWQKVGVTPEAFSMFLASLGVPAPLFFAYVVTYVELLGGLALILGFLTHWAAKLLSINMLVALFLVHFQNGFFLPMGYEFVLVLLAGSVSLMLTGPGAWALDSKFNKAG